MYENLEIAVTDSISSKKKLKKLKALITKHIRREYDYLLHPEVINSILNCDFRNIDSNIKTNLLNDINNCWPPDVENIHTLKAKRRSIYTVSDNDIDKLIIEKTSEYGTAFAIKVNGKLIVPKSYYVIDEVR